MSRTVVWVNPRSANNRVAIARTSARRVGAVPLAATRVGLFRVFVIDISFRLLPPVEQALGNYTWEDDRRMSANGQWTDAQITMDLLIKGEAPNGDPDDS